MGRLFWKFFIFFWLAQLTSVLCVGILIGLKHQASDRQQEAVDASPPAAFVVSAAAATLRHGGIAALRQLMDERSQERSQERGPPLVAIDDSNHDILGQNVAPELIADVRQLLAAPGPHKAIERVNDRAGNPYLLFVLPHHPPPPELAPGEHAAPPGGPPPPRERSPLPPLMPILAGGLVSLFFAAGLAWYFSKPIRKLRAAFETVADGRLEPQLAVQMGQRRDELADLGRDFDRMVQRLKSLMDSQRHLLHDVSHELRSPLSRLQAAIGLMRQQPERLEASLARIERESERMDKLVSELLTLSRLEAGMAGPLDETIDLEELLGHVVDDARFEAAARPCEVSLYLTDKVFVRGNAELLHRAIENIVRNAVKHSPQNTCVNITMLAADRQVRIVVEDRGPGVPSAELALIFKPFFRSAAQCSPDGHGLGLAISSRVVESLRGGIVASNRQDGGFRVTITLPTLIAGA
jgi:two-component system OmpR family sensor kinase